MIEKLLESLDSKVFTPELKELLKTQFNEAVEVQAVIIADARIDEEIDSLNEKSEQHIAFLDEKADEYREKKQQEMLESVDKYLDRVVDEFVSESQDALIESHKSEKADLLIEAFDSMLTAGGVSVANIVEARGETSDENQLSESVEKYDTLIDENITLKDENEKLIIMGVIAEMSEDLSIVESEKFKKLADLVEFSRDEAFTEKLETIKESVKGIKADKDESNPDGDDKKEKSPFYHLL